MVGSTVVRPRYEHPTPGELEALQVIWERGPSTVREVMDVLNQRRRRAYTSVMSLLGVMADKGLLRRNPKGQAFVYSARAKREKTVALLVDDLVDRAFGGSAGAMVCHLLERTKPHGTERDAIRKAIGDYIREGHREHEKGDE